MSNLGDVLSNLVHSNVSQTGFWGRSHQPPVALEVWGRSPRRWAIFVSFWEKKAILIPFDHILHVFRGI